MEPKLENELFRKYPKIFNGALVGHQIKCNDGWFHLLDTLAYDLQCICDEHPEIPQIQAFRVAKECGSLRFYPLGGNQYQWKLISKFEEISAFTCEVCGDLGKTVYVEPQFQCLCQVHIKE